MRVTRSPARLFTGTPLDEPPQVRVEAAELLPHLQERAGVGDGGVDLEAVADDARVGQQRGELRGIVPRDLDRIEAVENLAVTRTFPEHRFPAQSGLRAFEDQELE